MSTENGSGSPAPENSSPAIESQESNEFESSESEGSDQVDASSIPTEADIDNDPNLSKAEKKEVKKALRELEIKYNGKTSKEKLPFDVPEEHADWMRKQLQMAKMGQHKSQDYAALERDVMSFFNELKSDPRKALSNPAYGVDVKKLAAAVIEEEIANAQKSPEEIEREEYKRKLKEYEEKEKSAEEKMKQFQREQAVEKAAQQYDISMSQALESHNIPKTPLAVKKMAELMSLEIKRGYEPDMDSIAEMVQDEMVGDFKDHLYSMPVDKLVAMLGDELFERVRKERVAKIKKAPVPVKSAVKDVAVAETKKEEPKPKLTYRERFGV